MNLMKNILISLVLFWHSSIIAADHLPPPFSAIYKLYVNGIPVGKGSRSLTKISADKFKFETIGETTGLAALIQTLRIEEHSIFTQINGKIRPLEYTYRQTGRKARHNQVLFNWSTKTAQDVYQGETKIVSLTEPVLDRLIYQLVLMQELQQGKRQLQYQVVNKGKISTYIPTLLGKETVKTGLGELETLKYERLSSNKKRRTTLWCAPQLHYLPVRVEHAEKTNEVFSLVLESVQGLP
jgi:hypothetical protein